MAAETPDSMMSAMQADRRPAIWPWLVMPLIALTAFYCLDRLAREAHEQADLAPAPTATIATDSSTNAQAADTSDTDAQADESSATVGSK